MIRSDTHQNDRATQQIQVLNFHPKVLKKDKLFSYPENVKFYK